MLIRVFLHAEFISAIKTVQNPTIFMIKLEVIMPYQQILQKYP